MQFHAVAETKHDWVLSQKLSKSKVLQKDQNIPFWYFWNRYFFFFPIALEHISKGLILQKVLKILKDQNQTETQILSKWYLLIESKLLSPHITTGSFHSISQGKKSRNPSLLLNGKPGFYPPSPYPLYADWGYKRKPLKVYQAMGFCPSFLTELRNYTSCLFQNSPFDFISWAFSFSQW